MTYIEKTIREWGDHQQAKDMNEADLCSDLRRDFPWFRK